jgi:hypothetical protein
MYGTLVWDSLDMVFVRGFHWVQMIASDWKWDEPASIVSHMTVPLVPHRVIALCTQW